MTSPVVAPASPAPADPAQLRRLLLAVSVLDDVDVEPGDDGVVLLAGSRRVRLGLDAVAAVVGPWPTTSPEARLRVGSWLRAHRALAASDDPATLVTSRARALAVPTGGALDPGTGALGGWSRARVLGGVLEVGLGLTGAGADRVAVPLWPDLLEAAGLPGDDADALWAVAAEHAVRMGGLAAARLRRDGTATGVLRPVGGCDVLTLLATGVLRHELAAGDGTGLRAVAAPDRTRGWFDARRVDPDFVGAVWAATDPADRGVDAPLLVTADEVALVLRAA